MQYPATTLAAYQAPLAVLQPRAVQRRASVSDSVARLVAELAFDLAHREHIAVLTTGSR